MARKTGLAGFVVIVVAGACCLSTMRERRTDDAPASAAPSVPHPVRQDGATAAALREALQREYCAPRDPRCARVLGHITRITVEHADNERERLAVESRVIIDTDLIDQSGLYDLCEDAQRIARDLIPDRRVWRPGRSLQIHTSVRYPDGHTAAHFDRFRGMERCFSGS